MPWVNIRDIAQATFLSFCLIGSIDAYPLELRRASSTDSCSFKMFFLSFSTSLLVRTGKDRSACVSVSQKLLLCRVFQYPNGVLNLAWECRHTGGMEYSALHEP